jgi:2-polyprenyl-3-methyl-5-hydroxy-6-metoxy-1,4-benzoquinol methylase
MKIYKELQVENTKRLVDSKKRRQGGGPGLKKRWRNIVNIVVKYADKNKPLLEVGVLEGLLLDYFKQEGFTNLYGVDISPDAIERLLQRGYKGHVADAQEFISERKFDTVITSHMLEHCPEPQKVINNIYEVMNKGGILYVEVPLDREQKVPTPKGHYFCFETPEKLMGFFSEDRWESIFKGPSGNRLVFRRK